MSTRRRSTSRGVPRERLIGADFADYFTEPEKARNGYQRVFSEGFVSDYPLTIRHRDGKLTGGPLQREPIQGPPGHTCSASSPRRRERHPAEEGGGEERSRLAAIVDSTMDAIIGKSIDGVVTSWNNGAERMFAYAASEIIGRHVSLLILRPTCGRRSRRSSTSSDEASASSRTRRSVSESPARSSTSP